MARIPISQYQQRFETPSAFQAARVPGIAVDDSTGRALQGLGAGLGQLAGAMQRVQDEQGRAWASRTASDATVQWAQRAEELKQSAQPNGSGYREGLLGEFDAYYDKTMAEAPEAGRPFLQDQLLRTRHSLNVSAGAWQIDQGYRYTLGQYGEGARADAVAVALDPATYEDRRASRLAALNTSILNAADKDRLRVQAEQELAYAAGATTIDRNPHAAVTAFDAASRGETQQGYGWITRLDPDRIEVLRRRAQSQAEALDNRARMDADRAEAQGLQALQDADRQIATGVPAPSDSWLDWLGRAAGTPYEAEIRQRMQDEAEVQQVLRQPVAQQQAFVQARQAQQQVQGATPAQQAMLARLDQAVQANIKTLRTDPLTYAQQRTGVAIAPLDLGQALLADDASTIGPQVRARVATIRAVQAQNPDQAISMAPLLPGEAGALTNLFKSAPAAQKSQMLGTLYRAVGDSSAFDGMMNQIQGTDPFMARMGQRAASFEQAKLTNSWFSADVVQSAGDVVGISLHGDEILRNGGKDGTLKFPVPKDEQFVAALRDKVGNLYRGTGPGESGGQQFTQDAYAIKAYYTGRAAQEGDLSGVVDSGKLDQAIAAVVGQPVDFHGNGRVLAPWGMNNDDFTARANKVLAEQFQAAGVSDKIQPYMRNVGLIGVGGGVYFPTLAGTPISDERGRPLAIRLTPDADAGRDAYGRTFGSMIPTTVQPAAQAPKGMLQPGNIDLNARPVVRNADGSISTVRSMSIEEDGREVLIPTVAADGSGILSDDDAVEQYRRTGQHLGIFDNPDDASAYAEQLHQAQARQYGGRR